MGQPRGVGEGGLVGTGTGLWATADGAHWHQDPAPCPASDVGGLGSIAAASASRVVFLCLDNGGMGQMGKDVLRSSDGGKTVRLAGQAPFGGVGGTLAVPPHRSTVITVASSSALSLLYRSADGGKTWTTATYPDGGLPWNSLAYVTQAVWLGRGGRAADPRRQQPAAADTRRRAQLAHRQILNASRDSRPPAHAGLAGREIPAPARWHRSSATTRRQPPNACAGSASSSPAHPPIANPGYDGASTPSLGIRLTLRAAPRVLRGEAVAGPQG